MSCNSESRRAINYSLQEPINNKYDLWLSENLRYNSEGLQVYDSPGQPACDLILKIYKDGDWKPIAGLNTEHIVANKINIVDGVSYTYISPNDNTLHTNNGFQLNHLPLFRNPQDSPNELFDAGTLGEAIYGFVNESEWKNIFEGDAFSYAFKWYIEEGDTNINFLVDPAEADKLGGIYADEFLLTDIFPDSIEIPSQPLINNSYNWIALAKYKYNHGTSDYNLYVSAKDIIGAINHYQIENPEAPGIQPSNDFEWRLANTEEIGGIKADVHNHYANAFKPIECKFYPNYGNWSSIHERLCINARDVIDSIIESFSDPNENWLFGNHGITIGLQLGGNRIEWAIDGLGIANNGQYARCKVTEGVNRHSIEWVDLPEIETYDLLESGSSALEKYVVKGGSNDKHYLNGNGEWTIPTGTEYNGGTFIRINLNNIIDVRPNNDVDTRKTYICSYNGSVSWDVIDTGTLYQAGVGIKFGNSNSININTDYAQPGQVLSYDNNNNIEWKDVSYTSGNVIEITDNNTIQISSDDAENGDVIICDSGSVKWGAVPNPVINSVDIDDNDDNLTLNGFTLRNASNNIIVDDVPTQSSYEISTWTYYSLDNFKSFTIENAPDAREPIYIRIEDATGLACNCDHIDPLDILTSQSGAVLITLQFGIAKFEQITTPQSSEPEPEPSEPSEP